ncbi:hypothetical protein E2N92_03515 [Methanofollis formosanus]|uniref:Uncharacterized protein n=1 Tax=Methanofollis formosanus TaxID=299308 RepID=A0A8G1EH08_9EURY|nr:hypothetical protein E2N92_03515 [Methanofollis formosanus]
MSLLLLAGSLLVTAVCYLLGLPFFFLFLFVPLLPLFGRRPVRVKRCPTCGWETAGREDFCPWDGSRLTPADGQRDE